MAMLSDRGSFRLSKTHAHRKLCMLGIDPHPYRCIHIGWTLIVRVSQHGDDADEDGLHSVHWKPSLLCSLVTPLVLPRLMEDRNAHIAILVNCRVEVMLCWLGKASFESQAH